MSRWQVSAFCFVSTSRCLRARLTVSQAAVVTAESAVTALRTVVLAIAQATVMPQQCVGFIVKEEIYHVE